jgi:hypothetical protein
VVIVQAVFALKSEPGGDAIQENFGHEVALILQL